MRQDQLEAFNEHRPRLFAIAYRMLGSAMDAEDMVQETYVRFQQAAAEEVKSPRAYLTTILTRLCLNHLQSARVQREQYIGPWLPEPILTQTTDPERETMLAESLSMAFLVLLENFTPSERAVFLLHEVFEYDYDEIAAIVDKSEANCRQILRRARQHLAARRPRFQASTQQREQMLRQFAQASTKGDMQGLLDLLTEDVILWSDGGGKAVAALRPVLGSERVARFIIGSLRKLVPANRISRFSEINGQPGIVNYVDDKPHSVVTFEVQAGRIAAIYIISNPEKLRAMRLPAK